MAAQTVVPTEGPGDDQAEVVAAVDVGGTKLAVGLVDREGRVLARTSAPTPAREGGSAVLDAVAGLIASLPGAPRAVGVGAAGVVDPASGIVLSATDTLVGWVGTDVATGLRERTGLPVRAVNDVHAHALGEDRFGAAREHHTVLVVAVGTGIGGALVAGGELFAGRHAAAGHVGHVPSPHAVEVPCSCGAVGHLEGFAAGPGLAREYALRAGKQVGDLREVAELAAAGDTLAARVILDGGDAVGEAVAGFVNVLDPDVVVIGGGVAEVNEDWWKALQDGFARGVLPMLAQTPVVRSRLGGDAALLGAAALAWELA